MATSDMIRRVEAYKPEQLDDVVYNAASKLATEANNGGLEKQLYLLRVMCGWSVQEIIDAVEHT